MALHRWFPLCLLGMERKVLNFYHHCQSHASIFPYRYNYIDSFAVLLVINGLLYSRLCSSSSLPCPSQVSRKLFEDSTLNVYCGGRDKLQSLLTSLSTEKRVIWCTEVGFTVSSFETLQHKCHSLYQFICKESFRVRIAGVTLSNVIVMTLNYIHASSGLSLCFPLFFS